MGWKLRGKQMNETENKYKIGDKVKCISNRYDIKKEWIGEITEIYSDAEYGITYPKELRYDFEDFAWFLRDDELELVSFEIKEEDYNKPTENVQKEAEQYDTCDINGIELKVGDKVKSLIDGSGEIEEGLILTIKKLSYGVAWNTLEFEEIDHELYPSEVEKQPSLEYEPEEVAFSEPINVTKYWNILEECTELAKERETQYDDIIDNYDNIRNILNSISIKQFTNEDINNVMMAIKLGRRKYNPSHEDNSIDLINYTAIDLHLRRLKE